MSGDYSRIRRVPRSDYSAVRMQQGRVQLDSDWNEASDILDRRLRAGVLDMFGGGLVAATTPDAFRISLGVDGLRIHRGRMYVDGILAENRGTGDGDYDARLGERRGTDSLLWEDQPYGGGASGLPTAGRHLVYLDVWSREVTSLTDPDLIESAIGVDTSTRVQTAWQVKFLPVPSEVTCETPLDEVPGWEELVAPSSGRLTTTAVGSPAPEDPCFLPESGGYRGPENRLYRVEVHDGGGLSDATLKWSRDNGSIATTVLSTSGSELFLERVGVDAVRRLRAGDWVEITDDQRELAGLPGEMRRIQSVNEAEGSIELDGAAITTPSDPGVHLRVRRWDQQGSQLDSAGTEVSDVDANGGVIRAAEAGSIVLEDGVNISLALDPSNGTLRTGDAWCFTARTTSGEVESLAAAPPHTTLHHYQRLAIVDFATDDVQDCRPKRGTPTAPETEPPPGRSPTEPADPSCCLCVTPESHASGELTLQSAVNQRKRGGRVCVAAGVYDLGAAGLDIDRAESLTLTGAGQATILLSHAKHAAVRIEDSEATTLENLSILQVKEGEFSPEAAREALESSDIMELIFEVSLTEAPSASAVSVRDARRVTVNGCQLVQGSRRAEGPAPPTVLLDGLVAELELRRNDILGTVGISTVGVDEERPEADALPTSEPSVDSMTLIFELSLQDNYFVSRRRGVDLSGGVLQLGGCRIRGNSFALSSDWAISTRTFAGADASNTIIEGNRIIGAGTGIEVGTENALVSGNEILSLAALKVGTGIALVDCALSGAGAKECRVEGNRMVELTGVGISLQSTTRQVHISDNAIEGAEGGGIVMLREAASETVTVTDNRISDIGSDDSQVPVLAGVWLRSVDEAIVRNNTIRRVGTSAEAQAAARLGIELSDVPFARVEGNDVTAIGAAEPFGGVAVGVHVLFPFGRAEIKDNSVRRTPDKAGGDGTSAWVALRVGLPEKGVWEAGGELFDGGGREPDMYASGARVRELGDRETVVSVSNNYLEGAGGRESILSVVSPGTCQLSGNRLFCHAGDVGVAATVKGLRVIAQANEVAAPTISRSLDIQSDVAATVVGNVCSTAILHNGAGLLAPWKDLNVVLP